MAELTVTPIARAATPLPFVAGGAAGDEFANTGKEVLLIENTTSPAVTLTIVTQNLVDGEPVDDKEIVIGGSEFQAIGPFPKTIYNDGDNMVQISYSDETNIEVAVIQY